MNTLLGCKLVVVGDGGVGKTTLLFKYADPNHVDDEYCSGRVFDNVVVHVRVNDTDVELGLWDTAGQEEYDRLRPLSYPSTSVFLVCFDVASPDSFAHVTGKWCPELHHFCSAPNIVLCALKTDLRTDETALAKLAAHGLAPISAEQGRALATEIGAMAYFETSSVLAQGVKECFEGALAEWLAAKRRAESAGCLFGALFSRAHKTAGSVDMPPELPPRSKPLIFRWRSASTFAKERAALVGLPLFSDVDLFVDGQCIPAHRALLCAGSELWRRLFRCASAPDANVTHDDVNLRGALLPAIAAVARRRGADGRARLAVALGPQVSHVGAKAMLQFLYVGELPVLSSLDLKTALALASLFELTDMQQWCASVESERRRSVDHTDWTKAEKSTQALTEIATRHRQSGAAVLLNNAALADVAFVIESDGEILYSHRILLHAHSPVMARQFAGRFADGRVSDGAALVRAHIGGVASDTVLGLFEYVCCGNNPAAIRRHDAIDLMQLANRYDLVDLREQCELVLAEEMVASVWNRVLRSDVDVVELLTTAERQRAQILSEHLHHLIGAHHDLIRKWQPESWKQLESSESFAAIDEHKWPPQRYWDFVKAFEARNPPN